MSLERVQKILARSGVASRRGAEELIRQGRVSINGKPATLGDKADPIADAVKVDGRRVRPPAGRHYLLLNKPTGCMTTRKDPEGRPTIYDLVPKALGKFLFPVGRLDFDSEGLLLLTDDGDLAQRVSHPRFGCSKTYEVKVKGAPSMEEIRKLRRGIVLDGRKTRPARVEVMKQAGRGHRAATQNSWWRVVLSEGRTRQIREMFFRIGHPVQRLRRVAIGPVADPRLPAGEYRDLKLDEVEKLRKLGGPGAEARGRGKKGWA